MAIKNLTINCRRHVALSKNTFQHNDPKYKFAGWATSRENAKRNIVMHADEEKVYFNKRGQVKLYAVWKERDPVTTYENLRITSANVPYYATTAPIKYTITEVKTYEGMTLPYSKTTVSNIDSEASEAFLPNGYSNSEISTTEKEITVTYKHKASGLTAQTKIIQGGYTPIFKITCTKSAYGEIQCYQNNKQLTGKDNQDGTITYSSTSKNFTLVAVPKVNVDKIWIAKTNCAYYSKSYSQQLKHAAKYPNSNGCGSWTTITTKLYGFLSWTGGNMTGNTASTITVAGTVINSATYTANFVRIPLLANTVIGNWRPTWITYKQEQYTYTAYKNVYTWVPTCKTGLKYLKKYGINTMHEGRNKHGYYKTETVPYLVTGTKQIPESHQNKYYGAASAAAPYILIIPEDGKLKIKGKYGVNVYGCDCKTSGGFKIYKYSEAQNVYDDFLVFNTSFNNNDVDFSYELDVKKGQRYAISNVFSPKTAHIGVWIDSIDLIQKT